MMIKKILLALVIPIVILAVNLSFAEEPGQAVPQQAEQKNVTAIEIKGNKSISSNVVISKMKTRIGSAYQENIVSDDLKRLYLLGFFSDIKIDTQNYKDGLKVVVTVVERPIIEKISFAGISRITMKDEKLKEQLKKQVRFWRFEGK